MTLRMWSKHLLAWSACYLVPGYFTLGFHRFAKWYQGNGYYRFNEGTVIKLSNRRQFGFGISPFGVVVGYNEKGYTINMCQVSGANYFEWADTGRLPVTIEFTSEMQRHYKWNIENHFQRA